MALRLTDGQWERIREHIPEENIPDGRPGHEGSPKIGPVKSGYFWLPYR